MINFRFHLVSLVAVFLALGLGILVGSTVIDQRIVNRLDTEIRGVRKENGARSSENRQLSAQNKQLQQFIDATAPFVGDARLDGQSVAIIAERGVDTNVLNDMETLVRAAGADVAGVLWLDDSWALDTTKRLGDLRSALGTRGSATAMRQRAFNLLAQRLSKTPKQTSTSTSSSTSTSNPRSGSTARRPVDALAVLQQAGFVAVTGGDAAAFDSFPGHVADALVVTGDDSHLQGTDATAQMVRALTAAKVPTVVGAVYDEGSDQAHAPKRGASLAPVLDDDVLSREVSTVDDLDLAQGRVVGVLALEVVGNGTVGHYGYGSEASAAVPPHRS